MNLLEETPDAKLCGMDIRHGAHDWFDLPNDSETYRCPGVGLITVSWSELDTFRQCPLKHKLAYMDRWQRDPKDDSALGRGSLWHRVLEVHYKTIQAHQVPARDGSDRYQWDCTGEELTQACVDAVGKLLAELETKEERDPNVLLMLRWMYAGYLERYGLDEEWDIIAVENTVIVPLYEPNGSESWVKLKVKLDLLVRDHRGRHWVIDHKSCGSLPNNKDFDWADQFGLYVYALQRAGIRVTGAWHSAARTKMNQGDIIKPGEPGYKNTMKAQTLDQRFSRTPLDKTAAQLEGIAADALADFQLAYSDANHQRRRPNEEWCKWRCDFEEACMFGRRTGSDANMLDMMQRTGFAQDFTRH